MGRKASVDPCMFCGGVPCSCYDKPKKAVTKKVKPTQAQEKERMQERAKARKRVPLKTEAAPAPAKAPAPPPKRERVEIDETKIAIKLLGDEGMLHPSEKRKHPYAFPVLTLDERIKRWKEKVGATN